MKSPKRTCSVDLFSLCVLFSLCLSEQSLWGQARTLRDVYESLNLTLTLPPASRALSKGGNPRVDGALNALLNSSPSRSLGDIQTNARALGVPVASGLISVVATARTAAGVSALQTRITSQGGQVITVIDRSILARVPAALIEPLGMDPALAFLAPQDTAVLPELPAATAAASRGLLSAGVEATRANLLHQKGIRGAHIRIGILDFGFTGYKSLQQKGLVPEPKAVKAFNDDGGWDRVNHGTVHGAACAEIIHSMAPEAEIYIASVGDGEGGASWDQIAPAAMWLASQGVDIISYSGGSHGGAHNGKDLKDKFVEQIIAKGILWVASAGNEGDDHWSTTTQLNNSHLVLTGAKPFLLMGALTDSIDVEAVWDDWGPDPANPTSSQDFDIYLTEVDIASQRATLVAGSDKDQNGSGRPYERFSFKCKKGSLYALFIVAAHVTRSVRLHVFSSGVLLYPQNSAGSVGLPAENPKVLAVGAVNVDNAKLEDYSSQGPTDDGRDKPDVSAPDRVASQAYGGKDFTGTSAACPFAAGFAALVLQMRGKTSPADMVRIMANATTPLANNTGAGHGLIDASKLPGVAPAGGGRPSPSPGQPPPAPAPAPAVTGLQETLTSLMKLARADNALGVKVVVGHPEYRTGDGLKVGYRAEREAYCVVVRRNGSGQFSPLQPAGNSELHLAAGTPYVYPPAETQAIRLAGSGAEQMGIICSPKPIQLNTIRQVPPESLSVNNVSYQVR